MASINTGNFINDLTCPISLELLEDPILTNCCQKAFSRASLIQYISSTNYPKCPLCNCPFTDFDPINVNTNTIIASLVESLSRISEENNTQLFVPDTEPEPIWEASINQISNDNNILPIGELCLSLNCLGFTAEPSLFILCVDISGSMSGRPHEQCKTSLMHILSKTFDNPYVKTMLVTYESTARIIEIPQSINDVQRIVSGIRNGGGTNFTSAFEKIKEILLKHRNENISSVTIGFLTDGEDHNTHLLPPKLKNMINESWDKNFCVHSIAFGRSHDYEFLNNLRKIGTEEGTYRYTDYDDCDDALCNKLTSLFDVVSSSSVISVNIKLPKNISLCTSNTKSSEEYIPIQLNVGENGKGKFSQFVKMSLNEESDFQMIVNSKLNLSESGELIDTVVPIVIKQLDSKTLFDKYLVHLVDELATELLDLSNQDRNNYGVNTFELHILLILQRLNAINDKIGNDENSMILKNRLETIKSQIETLKNGGSINQMMLNNLRFDSKFAAPKVSQPKTTASNNFIPSNTVIPTVNETYKRIYLTANKDSELLPIHEVVIRGSKLDKFNAINRASLDDFNLTDKNGNTVLIWAAYTGSIDMIKQILKRDVTTEYINKKNNDGQSALEIALNVGYWISSELLIDAGATISSTLSKKILKLLYLRGHVRTADLINQSNFCDSTDDINEEMSVQTITYLLEKKEVLEKENFETYMDLALKKGMPDLVKRLIAEGLVLTNEMLYQSIVLNSENHVAITSILLDSGLDSNGGVPVEGGADTPIFTASKIGSLEHVKLFLKYGSIVDCPNELGNTSLWIACNNNRIDVAVELLNAGANPNYSNLKGNGPIMNCIQRGNISIVQLLLMRGVNINIGNENLDSPIHIACRSGQASILELLINKADERAIRRKAAIDGFNPLFCAVEADKDKCVKILLDNGADIEDKTDIDNPILPGGTPLHLAALYNRVNAAKVLLETGANPNSTDGNGDTILHTAVKQNNIRIIQLLRNYKVNILAKDRSNKIAAFYCKNNLELKRELVDPVGVILMKLAARGFANEEINACSVLEKHCGAVGCISTKSCVDIVSSNCRTPLMEAIIYSNISLVKTLIRLGADPYKKDNFDLDCFFWAKMIDNKDIIKLLGLINENIVGIIREPLNIITTVSNSRMQNAMVLYLSGKPPTNIDSKYSINDTSNISEKMNQYINHVNSQCTFPTGKNSTSIVNFFDKFVEPRLGGKEGSQAIIQQLIWNSKLFVVGMTASQKSQLEPEHLLSLYVFSSNTPFSQIINEKIITNDTLSIAPFLHCFINALNILPNLEGEVYRIVTVPVDRKLFKKGASVSWSTFSMASLSWSSDSFNFSNKKSGVIFLIKSKTAKIIKSYAQNEEDEPVVLLPNTKYVVSNYYECSPICLGQKNIRIQTFVIKDDKLDTIYNSDENIIIELTEI